MMTSPVLEKERRGGWKITCRAFGLLWLGPNRSIIGALKRRLGESASPEGLVASFRTREVAEPAL